MVGGSCLRRNDGEGRRCDGVGRGSDGGGVGAIGVGAWGARELVVARGRPTPHLASPLEGGRDELGKGEGGGCGWVVPACAGMTVRGAGVTNGGAGVTVGVGDAVVWL